MEKSYKLNIDKSGRIVIPEKLREQYGFTSDTMLDMIGTREGLLIRKAEYKLVKISKPEPKRDMEKIGIPKHVDASGRLVIIDGFRDRYNFVAGTDIEAIAIEEGVLIRNPGYMLMKISEPEQN